MTKFFRLLLITALLVSGLSIAPSRPASANPSDADIQAMVAKLQHEIEAIRGLKYTTEVSSRVVSATELEEFLKKEIEKQLPAEKEKAINEVYGQLGIIPKDNSFVETYSSLLEKQAGGIYNPDDNELFVVESNLPGMSDDGKITSGLFAALGVDPDLIIKTVLSHELCHALEDQNFHFNDEYKTLVKKASSDREFALQCLVEGSATRLMFDYVAGGVELAPMQRTFNRMLTNLMSDVTLKVPTYFKRTLTAPYTYGEGFVSAIMDAGGGWLAVDDAYLDQPTSMEQVLHPEKYFVDRDWPSDITPANYAGALGDGYKELMKDTLGEFVIDIMFSTRMERVDFDEAPKGWDGDRLVGIADPDGQVTIVWHSVWDSSNDAREFASALKTYLGVRDEIIHQTESTSYETSDLYRFNDADGREYIISRGYDEVIFIDNAPTGFAQKLYDTALGGDEVVRR